jgi:hypothetical protein
MSGSLSLLPILLAGASQGGTASLLDILYGRSGQFANAAGLTPTAALRQAEQQQVTNVKVTAAEPAVALAVAAFTHAVQGAKSVSALLANPRVMQVLLTANGLGDQVAFTALATKALTSDLTKPASLANSLTDTRWKTVASTYQFAAKGLSVIQDPKVIATIANAYAEVTWRKSLDQTTPGLSNALTFRAEAAKITSVDQILGDSVMRAVVTGALNIPREIAFQTLTAQETAIASRLDITKFRDPKFVESFVQRYLINTNPVGAGTAGLTV